MTFLQVVKTTVHSHALAAKVKEQHALYIISNYSFIVFTLMSFGISNKSAIFILLRKQSSVKQRVLQLL